MKPLLIFLVILGVIGAGVENRGKRKCCDWDGEFGDCFRWAESLEESCGGVDPEALCCDFLVYWVGPKDFSGCLDWAHSHPDNECPTVE